MDDDRAAQHDIPFRMNTALAEIEALMAHPAPALVFDTHEAAKVPRQ